MTNKEKESLLSNKSEVEIYQSGSAKCNFTIVKFCLTDDELQALQYALQEYSSRSPRGDNNRASLKKALIRAGIKPDFNS